MTIGQLRSMGVQAVALIALIALIAHPAFPEEDLELPTGEVIGGIVEDNGTGVLLVRPWGTREDGAIPESGTSVVRFSRTDAEIEVLPDFAVNQLKVLEDGLLFLGGKVSTGSGYVYRVVDMGKDETEILWDSDGLPADLWDVESNLLRIAKDGSRWGVMKTGLTKTGTERELEFFFGDLDSYEVEQKVTLEILEEHYDPSALTTDFPLFTFLDSSSESPVLAVSFSGEIFVVRIAGSSVRSEYLEHGKGSGRGTLSWQPDDRILWVNWGSEWSGYDLWDLGASAESPIPAILKEDVTQGYTVLRSRPHRQGGFVSVIADDGATTIRLSREGFETRSGTVEGSGAVEGQLSRVLLVSPNGYYAVAISGGWREQSVAKVFSLQ